ncbi:hypothetical protein KEJ27_10150 [Candidatus Bathyarchaeota archaeon]|nr:hypothetical protein [Candidatus Bathyarchaeota archaeon]
MKDFYLRSDVLEALAFQMPFHEVAFSWGRDRVIRPLKVESVEELRALLERYGSNEAFSVLRSIESFSNALELESKPPEALRFDWDFTIDIDSEEFELAKRAAGKLGKLLELFNISFLVKFSGRRGFHFIVPGKVFHVGDSLREYIDAYPRLPTMIADFVEACLNEPKLKLDKSIYAPRHLLRCTYSLHEKTGLVSTPVSDLTRFKLEEAKPENVKASLEHLQLEFKVGSGLELLKACGELCLPFSFKIWEL